MPKVYKVWIQRKASADIDDICAYISAKTRDKEVALNWADSVDEHISKLSTFPNGYPHFYIYPYRRMIHGRYAIVFRVD